MISTRRFGRLGNELYQYAVVIGYAIKHNIEFSLPSISNNAEWNPCNYSHLANEKWVEGREDILINEVWNSGQQFQEIPFEEEWREKQIVLNGYWQSYLYWNFCRDEVLKIFNIPYERKENSCSIHVRRGDYLLYPTRHPVITNEYISQAINIIKEKGINKFYVFGDDISWNLQNINREVYPDCVFVHVDGNTAMKDLSLMSGCEHQICSNSTLALWGAELNQNKDKIVIVPEESNWFGWENKLSVKDLYRPEWIRVKY